MLQAFQNNTMERMESMVYWTNEMMLQTVNAQLTGMNTTIKNRSAEGDARFTAIEARFARLEDADNRTNTKNLSVDKLHQRQEDENKTRAEAAGLH